MTKDPIQQTFQPPKRPLAYSVTEPLELNTQIRNSPFIESAQLAPSPHHPTSHRDSLPSPLHQNQATEFSGQGALIQNQLPLPTTMSETTTITSTTTTVTSDTRGGSLGSAQQVVQVATTAEQRIATAFATAFN